MLFVTGESRNGGFGGFRAAGSEGWILEGWVWWGVFGSARGGEMRQRPVTRDPVVGVSDSGAAGGRKTRRGQRAANDVR
jgi:hypothetical protein